MKNIIDTRAAFIHIEIMNDQADGADWEEFATFIAESERHERQTEVQGSFLEDLLEIEVRNTRETMEVLNEEEFSSEMDGFVEWYREKVSEYFDIELEEVELNIIS